MSEIDRYDPVIDNDGAADCYYADDGDYVVYADHLKAVKELESQHATLLANVGELVEAAEGILAIDDLQRANILKAAIAKLKQEDV